MKFKSKQDGWLTLIVWSALIFAMGSGVFTLINGQVVNLDQYIVTFLFSILLPILIIWMWLTVQYIINDTHLIVKYGPIKKSIPLESIKSVRKSMNPLSSPALSLKRLEITYGQHQSVLISPKNREEFMNILAKHCPQAKIGS